MFEEKIKRLRQTDQLAPVHAERRYFCATIVDHTARVVLGTRRGRGRRAVHRLLKLKWDHTTCRGSNRHWGRAQLARRRRGRRRRRLRRTRGGQHFHWRPQDRALTPVPGDSYTVPGGVQFRGGRSPGARQQQSRRPRRA